jgi:hypothetical protein
VNVKEPFLHQEGDVATNRQPVIVGIDGSPASFGAVRWAAGEAVRLRSLLKISNTPPCRCWWRGRAERCPRYPAAGGSVTRRTRMG